MSTNIFEAATGIVTATGKLVDWAKQNVFGHIKDVSMTDVAKLTRAEPITVVSQDCASLKDSDMSQILHTLTSIYSAYVLQTVAVLTRLNDIEVIRILDRINPDRDSTGWLLQSRHTVIDNLGADTNFKKNYKFALPGTTMLNGAPVSSVVSAEAVKNELGQLTDNSKIINENSNLGVGKMFNLSIVVTDKEGCEKNVTVPMVVRILPRYLDPASVQNIFAHLKGEDDLVELWHDYRAGKISFWKDMVFAENLIREYRKAALKDKTGTMKEIVQRANNARSWGVMTNNPSLAVATNLYVITKETAAMIEAKVGQKFSSPTGREHIFANTYAMVIAVVNTEFERVTFYINHVSQPATFSFRDLETKSGNKTPDIMDVMKSMMEGRAPSF